MKLYGSYTSPYVRHIRVVLEQLGFDYEFVDADYLYSARRSPSKRVPFFEDDSVTLTDSSSILLHLKLKAGLPGFEDVTDFELYTMANTAMDAEINLFLLQRDELSPENTPYLKRQRSRVESSLAYMTELLAHRDTNIECLSDGELRLACFLDWAQFRNRFSLDSYAQLAKLLESVRGLSDFRATAPPD